MEKNNAYPKLKVYHTLMDNYSDNITNKKNLQAAFAIVDAALLSKIEDQKVCLHPALKKRIAVELAKNPKLTPALFQPNFLNHFMANIIKEGTKE